MFLYIFKFAYLNTYMSFKLKFFLRVSNDLEKRKKWHQEIFLIKSFLKKIHCMVLKLIYIIHNY